MTINRDLNTEILPEKGVTFDPDLHVYDGEFGQGKVTTDITDQVEATQKEMAEHPDHFDKFSQTGGMRKALYISDTGRELSVGLFKRTDETFAVAKIYYVDGIDFLNDDRKNTKDYQHLDPDFMATKFTPRELQNFVDVILMRFLDELDLLYSSLQGAQLQDNYRDVLKSLDKRPASIYEVFQLLYSEEDLNSLVPQDLLELTQLHFDYLNAAILLSEQNDNFQLDPNSYDTINDIMQTAFTDDWKDGFPTDSLENMHDHVENPENRIIEKVLADNTEDLTSVEDREKIPALTPDLAKLIEDITKKLLAIMPPVVYIDQSRQRELEDRFVQQKLGESQWKSPEEESKFIEMIQFAAENSSGLKKLTIIGKADRNLGKMTPERNDQLAVERSYFGESEAKRIWASMTSAPFPQYERQAISRGPDGVSLLPSGERGIQIKYEFQQVDLTTERENITKLINGVFKDYIIAVEKTKMVADDPSKISEKRKHERESSQKADAVASGLLLISEDYFVQMGTYMRDTLIDFYGKQDPLAIKLDQMLQARGVGPNDGSRDGARLNPPPAPAPITPPAPRSTEVPQTAGGNITLTSTEGSIAKGTATFDIPYTGNANGVRIFYNGKGNVEMKVVNTDNGTITVNAADVNGWVMSYPLYVIDSTGRKNFTITVTENTR